MKLENILLENHLFDILIIAHVFGKGVYDIKLKALGFIFGYQKTPHTFFSIVGFPKNEDYPL